MNCEGGHSVVSSLGALFGVSDVVSRVAAGASAADLRLEGGVTRQARPLGPHASPGCSTTTSAMPPGPRWEQFGQQGSEDNTVPKQIFTAARQVHCDRTPPRVASQR